MSKTRLLVAGASGRLGTRVLELLSGNAAEVGGVAAATRTPERLAQFAGRGVEGRHADYDEPATLAAAFAGVERLLLISTDTLSVPGQRIR